MSLTVPVAFVAMVSVLRVLRELKFGAEQFTPCGFENADGFSFVQADVVDRMNEGAVGSVENGPSADHNHSPLALRMAALQISAILKKSGTGLTMIDFAV